MGSTEPEPTSTTGMRAWGLCGCWVSVNTRPGLDLRHGMHGWTEHAQHEAGRTRHAWCDVCSPNNPIANRRTGGPEALGRA